MTERKDKVSLQPFEKSPTNTHTKHVIDTWRKIEAKRQNHFVRIDKDKLQSIINEHYADEFSVPAWDQPGGIYPKNNKAFATQAIVSSVFNFAFHFPNQPERKYAVEARQIKGIDTPQFPLTGSVAMARRIYEAFGEKEDITSEMLKPYDSKEGIQQLFGDIPLPELRQEVLHDYIEGLEKHFNGSTAKILESVQMQKRRGHPRMKAFGKSGLVDTLISTFPVAFGNDKQNLYGFTMPFYKRAQLSTGLLEGRVVNSAQQGFVDIDKLGPIADYQLPKALASMGILSYSPELAQKIATWQIIPEGSPMEGEIRAATVVAVQELMDGLNKKRTAQQLPPVNMTHVDYWLWSMGRADKKTPTHITPTSNY